MASPQSILYSKEYIGLLKLARKNAAQGHGTLHEVSSEIHRRERAETSVSPNAPALAKVGARGESEHLASRAQELESVEAGSLSREKARSLSTASFIAPEESQHKGQTNTDSLDQVPLSPSTTGNNSRSSLLGKRRQPKQPRKEKARKEATLDNRTLARMTDTTSLFIPESETEQYIMRALPLWYVEIKADGYQMKQIARQRPATVTALEALKACVVLCKAESKPEQQALLYDKLRDHVHKAEIVLELNKYMLKKTKIFNPETGLPAIFQGDEFPSDVKADSYHLYSRWYHEDFEQDLLRGIVTTKSKDRNNDKLDPKYRADHPTTSKFHGQGSLVLGQWWPTQLCAVRDGAHGQAQGGISGERGQGAYSIVLSSGSGYHDQDLGSTILYSGTASKSSTPTENTAHLLQSIELRTAVRVLRSHQLPASNPYRPTSGLRYDGLYTVTGCERDEGAKALHRFRLVRCAGQEPIRCVGNAARPTVFEEQAWRKLRERMKW